MVVPSENFSHIFSYKLGICCTNFNCNKTHVLYITVVKIPKETEGAQHYLSATLYTSDSS